MPVPVYSINWLLIRGRVTYFSLFANANIHLWLHPIQISEASKQLKMYHGMSKCLDYWNASIPASAGTDPGTLLAAMNPMIPIIARRPLFNSRSLLVFNVSASTLEKSTGGKIIVGSSPPFR